MVSIIIPTYNRIGSLINGIESILKQKNKRYEIIVIDDGSTDGTSDVLKGKYNQIKVVNIEKRRGPSHARNIGILESIGDCLWFLDSDIVLPDDDILNRMISAFSAIPDVGSLGGEIVVNESILNRAYGRKITWNARSKMVIVHQSDGLVECDYLATCNCFTKRETVMKINGFDEQFLFGAEDMDFGLRIKKIGLKNYVRYNLSIYHFSDIRGRYENETTYYHKTRIQFAKKYYNTGHLFVMFFFDLLEFLKFYILLLPKLVWMISKKKIVKKQNLIGGWDMVKFYFAIRSRS